MIRLLAACTCAMAARRWPRLWFVAVALVTEHFTHELVSCVGALAPMVWASSSATATSAGLSLGTMPRRTACVVASVLLIVAPMFLPSSAWQLAIVCVASLLACIVLLARTTPRDVDKCIVAMLLAGNAATAGLALAIGIDAAYANGIVSTSNSITHVVVAGLALWTSRSR